MNIVVVVAGVLLGGFWAETFGAVAGGLLAWLLLRSQQQARQIAALQKALQTPAADAAVVPPGAETVAVPPLAPAVEPAAVPTPAPALAAAPAPVAAEAPVWAEPADPSGPSAPPAPSVFDEALARARAWLFGGNTIVKAGVGILFIGLAFLAKYASEHVQIAVEWRLAGIAAVAIVLLALGWRLRLARPAYAQVLQGGAVAVLYLTLFVAFRFYDVLAVGPVFALMVVVAALAAALAVLQDARPLAVIGALGGFATPLLVSTGGGDQVALFSYYLVLDLGIAAVAWFRTWRVLNLIGFIGTFAVGSAWGVMRYQPEHYASSQAFLIVYFLLFNAILLMPLRRPSTSRSDGWVNGSLLFGLPTISFALQIGLVRDTPYASAVSALVLAAFYVALARLLRSRLATLFEASLAIAIVFLTLVIPFALDARSTAGAWALEGAGLVWLGLRQARRLPRLFGYALLVLAGGAMLFAHERYGAPTAVFNALLFNALMAAAASLAAAFFVRRGALAGALMAGEAIAEPLLVGWATLWAVSAAGVQIDVFVHWPFVVTAWIVGLSAIALVFTVLSSRLDWPTVAYPVVGHAPLLALAVLAGAVSLSSPASGGGWWAWPLALAVHGFVLWRAASRWPAPLQPAIHALGLLLLAGLGALQGSAITRDWGDTASAWAWLGWLVVPALLLAAVTRPAIEGLWPVRAAPVAYRSIAGALLAVGLLLWTLLANLVSNGAASPLPYLPLLNPLDLGIGVALLAAWQWSAGDAARSTLQPLPRAPAVLLALAGFVWLNAMLVRAFHHFGDVPFRFSAWTQSLAVQTGITLLWTVIALVLMWLAARRALRLPWMAGAALLAAVVAKLVLVDLSGSGTVTRIVSFIGVGVLMLVIGYVAPLPSKGERHAAT